MGNHTTSKTATKKLAGGLVVISSLVKEIGTYARYVILIKATFCIKVEKMSKVQAGNIFQRI
jgi:hypothetical protein